MSVTKTTINAKIKKLANAEKVTKAMLMELSRDLLSYVIVDGTMDIDAVNRTVAVLTPMNKQTAVLFFNHFLPFSFDADSCKFGGLNKKQLDAKTALITDFLEDENQNIWTWAADNIKIEQKAVDYLAKITKDVTKALADEEQGTTVTDVMRAVLAADGITITDVLLEMQQAQDIIDGEQVQPIAKAA